MDGTLRLQSMHILETDRMWLPFSFPFPCSHPAHSTVLNGRRQRREFIQNPKHSSVSRVSYDFVSCTFGGIISRHRQSALISDLSIDCSKKFRLFMLWSQILVLFNLNLKSDSRVHSCMQMMMISIDF